ncbi:uncharacterized protein H4I96_08371 [Botrytis cinerea]
MRPATTNEKRLFVKDLFKAEERLDAFSKYFQVYDCLTSPKYAITQVHPSALNSHGDIRMLALELRETPQRTREEFKAKVFPQISTDPEIVIDQERAINVAVQITLMIDCSDKERHYEGYKVGDFRPVSWDSSEPSDGIEREECLEMLEVKEERTYKVLPDRQLSRAPPLRPQDNVVRLFRQTAFLKAHLRLSASQPIELGIAESLKLGTLPPQLLLETLHSLQSILFPPADEKSSRFLENIIQDAEPNFDPDCLLYEGYNRTVPENFEYHYWVIGLLS